MKDIVESTIYLTKNLNALKTQDALENGSDYTLSMDDKYFLEKARKFFLETQPNIEQLALLLKEVARDQRYTCIENITNGDFRADFTITQMGNDADDLLKSKICKLVHNS